MRVIYLAGPGDIIRTYKYWKDGLSDPNETNETYSAQFFDTCSQLELDAYIISTNKRKDLVQSGCFNIEHRPNKFSNESGLKYHYGIFLYTLSVISTAIKYRANVIVASSSVYWFLLFILPLIGVKVIPTLHCTLYSKYKRQSFVNRIISRLNSFFFAKCCYTILSASFELTRQIKVMAGEKVPVVEFLPLYSRDIFSTITPKEFNGEYLNIIYIGRIEREKGVLDLLKIYEALKINGLKLVINICGSGSLLAELKREIELIDAGSDIICHGHCGREQLISLISKSHLFVVPTRTDFLEGFNQVVVEAILASRPVVTSNVCPSMEHVNSAVLEVTPDDVNGYIQKIQSLYTNRQLYEKKLNACFDEQEKFYSIDNSWGSGLKRVLSSILNNEQHVKPFYLKKG